MSVCSACGHANSDTARFCEACAAPLAPGAEEHRKTVSVLFCDVVGSTALGESVDPEALRALLARYFEQMKAIVERHGGSVEKFIGDAVMAVFGVPAAHEDDALRACRAALEMRAGFSGLGVHGRIGINTGEVVTGTSERLATGDAVNVAARLQQAAQSDEVLIGEATLALASGSVEVEPLEPLVLKGKAQAVPAWRLLGVREQPGHRRPETSFVGRERELALIREAWTRASTERRCELVTIVGEAGVGKSRLVNEALAALEAKAVAGRCPPYGDGITYWPVVEVVKQLDALPSDRAAAAAIRSLLGQSDEATTADEIAWAFRKLLEEQAPLVVFFDDIHSGAETFLDLVEGVALMSVGAPILLLCMARPELLERRPRWPVALRLEPLGGKEAAELIGDRVPASLRERIAHAAGGNPLFLTEMLAMAGEREDVEVPPTLGALLAARLDQLDMPERRVLERGAVEGEIFHRGAVQALAPEETHITPRLASLTRQELIRPDKAQLPGEDGFRFRHLLIRDAAYDSLAKSTRAELHLRFAAWLEQRGGNLVELDEILGYHLEQAHRYRVELGHPDPALAERASDKLAAAGRRALWRGDDPSASSLLERALELTRSIRFDVTLEVDFAAALHDTVDGGPRAIQIAEAAADRAGAAGDEAGQALARVVAAHWRHHMDMGSGDERSAFARRALPLLERDANHAALVHVWWAVDCAASASGRYEEAVEACEQAIVHADLAGQHRSDLHEILAWALARAPRPADEALRRLDERLPPNPVPGSLLVRAWLLATLGRFDEARPIALAAAERLRELSVSGRSGDAMLAEIARLAGDHEAAAQYLYAVYDRARDQQGNSESLADLGLELGHELCALGRYEEAERLARQGREHAAPDDWWTQAVWRQTHALVLAHRGEQAEAERLARDAVEIVERTDFLDRQGEALIDLAEVLCAAGSAEEAAVVLRQALRRFERKRSFAMVAQVRTRLEALRQKAPA